MNNSDRLVVMAAALAACTLAMADDSTKPDAAANSPAVEALKSSLGSTVGFEVRDVRQGDDGVTCIVYSDEDTSKAYAVVDGEKVLRSSSRSKSFERAWNEKCARSKDS